MTQLKILKSFRIAHIEYIEGKVISRDSSEKEWADLIEQGYLEIVK